MDTRIHHLRTEMRRLQRPRGGYSSRSEMDRPDGNAGGHASTFRVPRHDDVQTFWNPLSVDADFGHLRRSGVAAPSTLAVTVGGGERARKLAGPTGLEPATSGVTGRHSNQLNYDPAR